MDWLSKGFELIDSLWVTPQEQFDAAAQQRQLEAQLQAQELQLQLARTQTAPATIGANGGLSSTVLIGGGLVLALLAALVILR